MKITLFVSSLGGGGAERTCVIIANSLVNFGHRVDLVVLNLDNSKYLNDLNSKVRLVNLKRKHARTSFWPLYNYLKASKAKKLLVFNHEIAVILVLIRIIFKLKVKIYARIISTLSQLEKNATGLWHGYLKNIIVKYYYRKIDYFIAQSEGMKLDAIENYSINPNKIFTINNPVVTEHRQAYLKAGPPKKQLLFIGRLEKEKGLKYLFQAFARITKNYPSIKLIIAGEGSQKSELTGYAKDLNISSNICFIGFQRDVYPLYRESIATVMTSLYEGFPNVLVESIACGTPVVSFDCLSGPREIIIDGLNGFLVRYLDVDHLEEMITKALNKPWDPESIVQASRPFHIDNIIPKYLQLLEH